jgi:hypothetical protein
MIFPLAFQIYGALLGIDETANSNTSCIEKKQDELFPIGRISVLFNNYRNYDFSLTFSFFVPFTVAVTKTSSLECI